MSQDEQRCEPPARWNLETQDDWDAPPSPRRSSHFSLWHMIYDVCWKSITWHAVQEDNPARDDFVLVELVLLRPPSEAPVGKHWCPDQELSWEQGSWGQHGAHLGPTGPRWAPCWPHELCYLGISGLNWSAREGPSRESLSAVHQGTWSIFSTVQLTHSRNHVIQCWQCCSIAFELFHRFSFK